LIRAPAGGPAVQLHNWADTSFGLSTRHPSFVDGRTDLFDDAILNEYLLTAGGLRLGEVFARWGIRLALLEPDAPLVLALEAEGWSRLYEDDQAVILGRPDQP
jgi:hypothetical protein